LGETCIVSINQFIKQTPNLINLNLSKNLVDLNKIIRLESFKEIILNNCKLGNDPLEKLFDRLRNSAVERLSLSSPELKNRNQLTRYDRLISLIKNSSTLRVL